MVTQSQQQIEDDEISLIDILLFLKASGRNNLISSIVCLLIGVAYYFAVPKMYEATATIQMALVAGEAVETPAILLEKFKLPLFFSSKTLQACGSDRDFSSLAKFADKLKPAIDKSATFISLTAQARSTQEALACLEAVISETQKSQNDLAKPLLDNKKQELAQLSDQLKAAKEMAKSFPTNKANNNETYAQYSKRILVISYSLANTLEMSDLRKKIMELETELMPHQTRPLSLVAPIYAPEVPNNKRPVFTLALSLILGVFTGLLITGLQRVVPKIRRQIMLL
jgi:hypothetical protein